ARLGIHQQGAGGVQGADLGSLAGTGYAHEGDLGAAFFGEALVSADDGKGHDRFSSSHRDSRAVRRGSLASAPAATAMSRNSRKVLWRRVSALICAASSSRWASMSARAARE